MSNLEVVILAAGQGTRMRSSLPKVLHTLSGKPLLQHVIDTALKLNATKTHVVYGHGGEMVKESLAYNDVSWVIQEQQLGTGHAVAQSLPNIDDASNVLILYGDVPLTKLETLNRLIDAGRDTGIALLTVRLKDPYGYGRIVRSESGAVKRIVEQKDADDKTRLINEGNSGMLVVKAKLLKQWVERLDNNNVQGEFYLTDIIEMAVNDGIDVNSVICDDEDEVLGVNDRKQLAYLERVHQQRIADELMVQGVTVRDPHRLDIRGELVAGKDVELDVGVIIKGKVILGDNVKIGANSILIDSEVGSGTEVLPMSLVEQSVIGSHCVIGPYARLRPDTVLDNNVRIGNFVEIKKSDIGHGSKVNHLSYIGDSEIGKDVNVGAGTITCNYDGAHKHKTVIKDNAFIGSDTQLVAPVTIGKGATIAAGSTITRDVFDNNLTLTRVKQKSIENWQRPTKDKKDQ